jgi:CRP-like cAMP-binding protein
MTSELNSPATVPPQPVKTTLAHPLPLAIDAEAMLDDVLELRQQWLSAHSVWSQLPTDTLQAIARSFQRFAVEPQTLIYQEGQSPIGLYLVRQGTIEIFRQSPIGDSLIRYRDAGDLFGYMLVVNDVEGTYQTSAIALTPCEIWFLPRTTF